MGAGRFDITNKPLHKAKPCIMQLIRDDGTIEWYEGLKAGQLVNITSGRSKAYINLDFYKIKSFNIDTDERELAESQKIIDEIKKDKEKLSKELDELSKKQEKELLTIRGQMDFQKKVVKLKGKYNRLLTKKIKNFGSKNKPVLGFVCYEKEFNALPNDNVEHDSKQVTLWMDVVTKNYKDFVTQKLSGISNVVLVGGLVVVAILFVLGKYGDNFFKKKETAKAAVQMIPLIIGFSRNKVRQWLTEKKE